MLCVVKKKCESEGCSRLARFGLPGEKAKLCDEHQAAGMVMMCTNKRKGRHSPAQQQQRQQQNHHHRQQQQEQEQRACAASDSGDRAIDFPGEANSLASSEHADFSTTAAGFATTRTVAPPTCLPGDVVGLGPRAKRGHTSGGREGNHNLSGNGGSSSAGGTATGGGQEGLGGVAASGTKTLRPVGTRPLGKGGAGAGEARMGGPRPSLRRIAPQPMMALPVGGAAMVSAEGRRPSNVGEFAEPPFV